MDYYEVRELKKKNKIIVFMLKLSHQLTEKTKT